MVVVADWQCLYIQKVIFEIAAGLHDKILHRQVRAVLLFWAFSDMFAQQSGWVSDPLLRQRDVHRDIFEIMKLRYESIRNIEPSETYFFSSVVDCVSFQPHPTYPAIEKGFCWIGLIPEKWTSQILRSSASVQCSSSSYSRVFAQESGMSEWPTRPVGFPLSREIFLFNSHCLHVCYFSPRPTYNPTISTGCRWNSFLQTLKSEQICTIVPLI